MKLKSIKDADKILTVLYENGEKYQFSHIWLRDHCPQSMTNLSQQREVETFYFKKEIIADTIETNDNNITIHWKNESHTSIFNGTDLYNLVKNTAYRYCEEPYDIKLWNKEYFTRNTLKFYDYTKIKSGDKQELYNWLTAVKELGFGCIEGIDNTKEGIMEAITQVAYIRETIFGGSWDFKADGKRADTAYTNLGLGQHTDSTYSFDSPMQVLAPLLSQCTGGETIMNDGFYAAEIIRKEDPEAFELLSTMPITGQYLEDGIFLKATRPAFLLDANGKIEQVSFNHYDRAPMYMPPKTSEVFYRGYGRFHEIVQSDDAQLVFPIKEGQLMMFDNMRVLHGRTAFEGPRHMAGGYLNVEDFDSKYRLLKLELGL